MKKHLDEVRDDWHDASIWANSYSKEGYTDWSLPELDQLKIIYNDKSVLNKGLADPKLSDYSNYWSGSEGASNDAWVVDFSNGDQNRCCAVRAF